MLEDEGCDVSCEVETGGGGGGCKGREGGLVRRGKEGGEGRAKGGCGEGCRGVGGEVCKDCSEVIGSGPREVERHVAR